MNTCCWSGRSLRSLLYSIILLLSVTFSCQLHAQSSGKSELPWFRESSIDIGTTLWSVDALNIDTVMTVGDGGLAQKTTNRGELWSSGLHADSSSNILLGIAYADTQATIAVGYDGTIVRSIDGGQHWTRQMSRPGLTLFGVLFTDPNTGTVVGDSGTILRTTDGGATWARQDSGKSYMLLGVSFADAKHGIAVGGGGKIRRTTDGGGTWSDAPSGVSNYLYGVSYIDSNTATAVGTMGKILRSTNGGASWTPQTDSTSTYFYGVSFSDVNSGMAVGDGGRIVITSDGGASWKSTFSGKTSRGLYGVAFFDTSHWYAVGGSGTIVRMGDSSVIVTGMPEEPNGPMPTDFELKQNYPNPFNPTTTFSFVIGRSSSVTLKIYDVVGRAVTTIVDRELPPGSYSPVWNAAGITSGVYFYRLEAVGLSNGRRLMQTKKLLLLK